MPLVWRIGGLKGHGFGLWLPVTRYFGFTVLNSLIVVLEGT